jgi:hypothetical protein
VVKRNTHSFAITYKAFSRAAATSSLAWIALSIATTSRTLVEGTWLNKLRYQWTHAPLPPGLREELGGALGKPQAGIRDDQTNPVPACMGGCLSRGLNVAANIFFTTSRHTRLSRRFAKAGAAIHGMAASCLGRAKRSSPKARRVARPALAARGLDGDSACQATICVAMSWSCENQLGSRFLGESVHFTILQE